LRLFSFGGYGLALAALALVIFGAYDSYPKIPHIKSTEHSRITQIRRGYPVFYFLEMKFHDLREFFVRYESASQVLASRLQVTRASQLMTNLSQLLY